MKPFLYLILFMLVAGVSASTLYTSSEGTGHVNVVVRCQHNLFSKEMILTSLSNNVAMSVYIRPDGRWDTDLVPGEYALILLDGNAGQREYSFFTVREGETVIVPFIGHAISDDRTEIEPMPTPTPVPTPICYTTEVCTPGYWEGVTVSCIPVWHPPVCRIEIVCR